MPTQILPIQVPLQFHKTTFFVVPIFSVMENRIHSYPSIICMYFHAEATRAQGDEMAGAENEATEHDVRQGDHI